MDKRIIKTKKAIQTAYFTLLNEKEKKKITISAIARKANIDRKTFYLHYNTPDDIVREYAREKVKSFCDALEEQMRKEEVFSIDLFFDVLIDMVLGNLKLVTFLTSLDDSAFFFDEIKAELVNAILRNFPDSLNLSVDDITIYADFYLSGIISSFRLWAEGKVEIPIEELAEKVRFGAVHGLMAVIEQ